MTGAIDKVGPSFETNVRTGIQRRSLPSISWAQSVSRDRKDMRGLKDQFCGNGTHFSLRSSRHTAKQKPSAALIYFAP
jgi:hypothetical protein